MIAVRRFAVTDIVNRIPSIQQAAVFALMLVGVWTSSQLAWAEDDEGTAPPAKSQSADDAKTAEEKVTDDKASNAKEPSLLEKLSKELFKELDDDPLVTGRQKVEKKEDKFERVAKGMRTASRKLDEQQTSGETTKIQEQVIRDLDDLIKQLQNPPPPKGGGGGSSSSSSSSSGGSASRQPKGGGRTQKDKSQGGGAARQSGEGGKETGSQDRSDAQDSDERSDSERKAAAEAARKRKLEMDVWGHLPPHLREQLLNTYGERVLPKYEQLVKQFYEALSEQNDAKPRR